MKENTIEIKINAIKHKNLSLNRLNQSFESNINLGKYKKYDLLDGIRLLNKNKKIIAFVTNVVK